MITAFDKCYLHGCNKWGFTEAPHGFICFLTKFGAKMIKDFNFSPGAKVKTFGLFNYTDKCGKLKLENACCGDGI